MHRIGIVGSGPAAFYTALKLIKSSPSIKVDIFEKLPVPFGLVRYGVAPDHPEVKNVINTFNQVAQHGNFRFFGNVTVGRDITIKEMKEYYSAVVLAYGAAIDKKLGIPGEDFKQVYSATDIVGWYNGLPEKDSFLPDLSGEEAAIVGHGNVALDIARILLTPIDLLKKTDMPDHVVEQLAASKIRRIHLIGRRGPLQVSFTIKEFREITRLNGVSCEIIIPSGVDTSPEVLKTLPRPRHRLTDLILETSKKAPCTSSKGWIMHFLRSPLEVLSSDNGRVTGLSLGVNHLRGEEVVATDKRVTLPCDIVVRCIGYRSVQIDPDIPFEGRHNVVPNDRGRVAGVDNLYCVGWIKRGPVGVIINTLSDAQETSETILADLSQLKQSTNADSDIDRLLAKRGIKTISFSDWEAIDRVETSIGSRKGKPREKMTNLMKMMETAKEEKDNK